MTRLRWQTWALGALLISLLAVSAQAQVRHLVGDVRNPFGVADVVDPYGSDVQQFARSVQLPGGPRDPNAAQWAPQETSGKSGTLEGTWYGRWEDGREDGSGTALVKSVNNRVYVLYTDTEGRLRNTTWLLEAIREGENRLVGRWVQVGNARDTGPYVGLIVNNERIDGTWGGGSRWDFRRKLAK